MDHSQSNSSSFRAEELQAEVHYDLIFKAASSCQKAFSIIAEADRVEHSINLRLPLLFEQKPQLSNRPLITLDDVRDDYEQYRVWAGNLGVFAPGEGSLDFRLRDASDIRNGFVSLLDGLSSELVHCLQLLKADQILPVEDDQDSSSATSSDTDDSLTSELLKSTPVQRTAYELQIRFRHISDIVDKLIRLAEAIRASSSKSHATKAAAFELVRDGVNLSEQFEKHYLPHLLRCRFKLEEPLLSRFAKAISLRRRRFEYQRKHQKKLAYGGEIPTASTPEPTKSTVRWALTETVLFDTRSTAPPARSQMQSITSTPTRATTLPQLPLKRKAPSQIVSASFKSVIGNAEVPPPPPISERATHFQCPYCSILLPRQKASPKQWRLHVIADLQPFVCIEPTCSTPDLNLETYEAWLEHQKWEHAMEWWCEGNNDDHNATRFLTADAFAHHLRNIHDLNEVNIIDKHILTAGRPSLVPFSCCPLCDYQPTHPQSSIRNDDSDALNLAVQSQKLLQRHIADELLNMFLLALPDRSDLHDTNADTDAASAKRSSIQAMSELSLTFDQTPSAVVISLNEAYLCKEVDCSGSLFGFATDQDLRQHMLNAHTDRTNQGLQPEHTIAPSPNPIPTANVDIIPSTDLAFSEEALCDPIVCEATWRNVWSSPELSNSVRETYKGCKDDELLQEFAANSAFKSDMPDKRQRYFSSLNLVNGHDRYNQIPPPHPGTGVWFANLCFNHYLEWNHGLSRTKTGNLLYLHGAESTGKSTLMKSAEQYARSTIEQVFESESNLVPVTVISFYFSSHGNEYQRTLTGMYSSLLIQLLKRFPDLQDCFDQFETPEDRFGYPYWTVSFLEHVFSWVMSHLGNRPVLCFIDALDECSEAENLSDMSVDDGPEGEDSTQAVNLTFLNDIARSQKLCAFYVSSRYPPRSSLSNFLHIPLSSDLSHISDIANSLKEILRDDRLPNNISPSVARHIARESKGNFLWANKIAHAWVAQRFNGRGTNGGKLLPYQEVMYDNLECLMDCYLDKSTLTESEEEAAQLLLSHGCFNVNKKDQKNMTPLRLSIAKGNIQMVALLLTQKDIDVNVHSLYVDPTLHAAVRKNNAQIVQMLLNHTSIDPNILHSHHNTASSETGHRGKTALMIAISERSVELTKLLLSHPSTDVNIQDSSGDTALMLSAMNGQETVMKLLLGVSTIQVNLVNDTGKTALWHAAYNKFRPGTVTMLLDHPSTNVDLRDSRTQYVMKRAQECGFSAIVAKMQSMDTCADIDKVDKETKGPFFQDEFTSEPLELVEHDDDLRRLYTEQVQAPHTVILNLDQDLNTITKQGWSEAELDARRKFVVFDIDRYEGLTMVSTFKVVSLEQWDTLQRDVTIRCVWLGAGEAYFPAVDLWRFLQILVAKRLTTDEINSMNQQLKAKFNPLVLRSNDMETRRFQRSLAVLHEFSESENHAEMEMEMFPWEHLGPALQMMISVCGLDRSTQHTALPAESGHEHSLGDSHQSIAPRASSEPHGAELPRSTTANPQSGQSLPNEHDAEKLNSFVVKFDERKNQDDEASTQPNQNPADTTTYVGHESGTSPPADFSYLM